MFQLLIVDDEANVVDGLADTLPWREIGIRTVYKAYSAFEALEILKTNSIHILMSDIQMPGMNGLELLEEVQRNWKKTKCILLTGYADFTYAQKAIEHNTCEYLLKPISDEEVMQKVKNIAEILQKEWEDNQSYHRAVLAFEENLPKLRGELLNELLQGRRISTKRLTEKLEMLRLQVAHGDFYAFMMVRLEGKFTELDFYSLSLMEYAIGNMAAEIFEDYFDVWLCKDVHDYLVFMVTLAGDKKEALTGSEKEMETAREKLQLMAANLQLSVNHYLQGTVSVLVSQWGLFPDEISKLYQGNLSSLRRQVGSQNELFISVSKEMDQLSLHSLQSLYEPPMLVHLLESGNWEVIEDKLKNIFFELNVKWAESNEHLIEVFFLVYSAYTSFAHKNGRELADMIGPELAKVTGLTPCRSNITLQNWAFQAFRLLQKCSENETKNDRENAVDIIRQYVQKHLVKDVSLQAIADYIHMHPVHVSRIYKLVTGDNLSDYVFRLKMEMAASLLKNSSMKNYEIALHLGYQNPNYFIKVFKKYYSLSPQEFRLNQAKVDM